MDTPLSIVGNVTGILTFVAAAWAFVYVRYTTLRNSYEERLNIMSSATNNFREMSLMSTLARNARHRSDAVRDAVERLFDDILRLEYEIVSLIMKIYDHTHPFLTDSNELPMVQPEINLQLDWKSVEAAVKAAREDTCNISSTAKTMVTIMHLFIPTSIVSKENVRWYQPRPKVLEMVREREALRSRLLYRQLSMINEYGLFSPSQGYAHSVTGESRIMIPY